MIEKIDRDKYWDYDTDNSGRLGIVRHKINEIIDWINERELTETDIKEAVKELNKKARRIV